MTAATEPVGASQVFPRTPMETLFKERYFVSGMTSAVAMASQNDIKIRLWAAAFENRTFRVQQQIFNWLDAKSFLVMEFNSDGIEMAELFIQFFSL